MNLTAIVEYFAQDPLRIVYLVGGSGGIYYWFDQWRDRRRVSVRWQGQTFDVARGPNLEVTLMVEITNLGGAATSLEPIVEIRGLGPDRKPRRYRLEIKESKRMLPSHEPMPFHAMGSVEAGFMHLWYGTYSFALSRGSTAHVRIRNARQQILPFWLFIWERTRFRLGVVRADA